ncbi:MAG: undecaprenyldiphospho-muramoylpentapeptide beta-N-acetylglucosaminyltransferase [Gemmatimonadota bacterium]|nr:undecaprenyldiphospho-muramoylpentapeptide beta-N-acetylglucosaminyltransferase [Gemmatimonadota bacterium]
MREGPVVVFSGGGTGGHLYPALAIADALRAKRPDVRAMFFGAERGLEAQVLPERGELHRLLPVHGIDRANLLKSSRAVTGLFEALIQVVRCFDEHRPTVVVVTGGYAGAPAGIAAGLIGIPLVLQEQNSVPGLVTKLLTRWATRVHVAYPEALDYLPQMGDRAFVTGNPVRPTSVRPRDKVRAEYGVPAPASLILVAGGSQGSLALNQILGEMLKSLNDGSLAKPSGLHVLWATGPKHIKPAEHLLEEFGSPEWIHTSAYIKDMPSVLEAADLAICRAGAMFTAELLNAGLPAVLVPLPTAAEGHQMQNALALEAAGVAVVSPQEGLTGDVLWAQVKSLFSSPERLSDMTELAYSLARPNAASAIATDIELLLDLREEV